MQFDSKSYKTKLQVKNNSLLLAQTLGDPESHRVATARRGSPASLCNPFIASHFKPLLRAGNGSHKSNLSARIITLFNTLSGPLQKDLIWSAIFNLFVGLKTGACLHCTNIQNKGHNFYGV